MAAGTVCGPFVTVPRSRCRARPVPRPLGPNHETSPEIADPGSQPRCLFRVLVNGVLPQPLSIFVNLFVFFWLFFY